MISIKSNGSKFSKLLAGLVAASAIMPAIGGVSTSAMENEIDEFTKERNAIFNEVTLHAQFVDGISNNDIFALLVKIVPNAIREIADRESRQRDPAYPCRVALENACTNQNLKYYVSNQLIDCLTKRGNNPRMQLWDQINENGDLEEIIKKMAVLHCKGPGLQ